MRQCVFFGLVRFFFTLFQNFTCSGTLERCNHTKPERFFFFGFGTEQGGRKHAENQLIMIILGNDETEWESVIV